MFLDECFASHIKIVILNPDLGGILFFHFMPQVIQTAFIVVTVAEMVLCSFLKLQLCHNCMRQ